MATSPLSLEQRRKKRDERAAVQEANQIVRDAASRGRAVTLEWAAVAVLLALGVAAPAAVWYRQVDAPHLGTALWAGLVMGALLATAILQAGRGRLIFLALTVFTGLPVAAIPLGFLAPARQTWFLWAAAALGAAAFGGGLRWAIALRSTLGTLRANASATGETLGTVMAAIGAWFRDALIKWLASLIMLAIGAGLIYLGRQQQREAIMWAGLALLFLIGSTGIWAPGLRRRTRLAVGLRHCGQLCFWLSFLLVPLIELPRAAALPYVAQPSVRFAVMGVGLVVVGATWWLQRNSIFSHHTVAEAKRGPERMASLAIVVLGLALTLAGVEAHERMKVSVDQNTISQMNFAGSLHFQPVDKLRSLVIVQPIERLPLYVEYVQFEGGTTYTLFPLLYPGQQIQPDENALVQAVRTAGSFNTQGFPENRVEEWTR